MSKPKKPRDKKHVPRPRLIPAIIPVERAIAVYPLLPIKLHAAIVTMIERPTVAHCNHLTNELCVIAGGLSHAMGGIPIMQHRDASAIAIQSAILTLEAIIDRKERTGTLAVTAQEAASLRTAGGKIDDALRSIPINCYQRAQIEVEARKAVVIKAVLERDAQLEAA